MEDTTFVQTVRYPPSGITEEELIVYNIQTLNWEDFIESMAFLFISKGDRVEGRYPALMGAIHTNSPTLSGDAPPPANLQGGMASSRLKEE